MTGDYGDAALNHPHGLNADAIQAAAPGQADQASTFATSELPSPQGSKELPGRETHASETGHKCEGRSPARRPALSP